MNKVKRDIGPIPLSAWLKLVASHSQVLQVLKNVCSIYASIIMKKVGVTRGQKLVRRFRYPAQKPRDGSVHTAAWLCEKSLATGR